RTPARAEFASWLILLAIEDATECKRSEDALKEAARRKDEVLAMLAHELRIPLAPVMTVLLIIVRSTSDLPTVQRAVGPTDGKISHRGGLEDLLDVSRITRGKTTLKKEDVDLHPVVKQAIETAQHHTAPQRHRMHQECCHLPVRGDPARLHQV